MTLRVLMFQPSEQEAELAVQQLKSAGFSVIDHRVDTRAAFERALESFSPGLVLADVGTGQFTALAAIEATKAREPAIPVVVLAATLDEESLVACLGAGADDVVLRSNLSRLTGSVKNAIERRESLQTLSPRQLEVLLHVVAGKTTREIAESLGLSLKTAETHRITMMKRLGIHDVAGLVRYAVRVRLIAPDS